jgi:hypothetical protein
VRRGRHAWAQALQGWVRQGWGGDEYEAGFIVGTIW